MDNNIEWKTLCALKRRAQASNVIIIETADPMRVDELLTYIKEDANFPKQFALEDNLTTRVKLDTFEGLFDIAQKEDKPIKGTNKSLFSGSGGGSAALNYQQGIQWINNKLKTECSTAVITSVTFKDHARAISTALQNWAYDGRIAEQRSSVFVITPNSTLFDDTTRRCCILIEPPLSTEDERKKLITNLAQRTAENFNVDLKEVLKDKDTIIHAASGLTLHDIETAVLESIHRDRAIKLERLTRYKMNVMKKHGYELVYPKRGWESVGGYDTLKDYIQHNVIDIIKDPTARSWGIGASRGILFFGIGGTGKTVLAKAMSKEAELPFIKVSSADLFRGIVGETERAVKTLQQAAEANAPCITFFDEIDQIGLKRGMVTSTDSGVGRRATNMFMDWLGDDERKAIIVGATNLIEEMDEAFIRAGRFDEKIPLFPPDYNARIEIFRVHTAITRNIPLRAVRIKQLARKTALWTGAEIELLCVASARIARSYKDKTVRQNHFLTAIEEVTVNLEQRATQLEHFTEVAQRFASNKRLLRQQLNEYVKREKGGKKKTTSRLEEMLKQLD